MNQYKRLLSNTFIFAVGTFSSKILVILMLRFYTGILTQDEMGVADLIVKTTSILYPVVSLSIGQAVIRYGLLSILYGFYNDGNVRMAVTEDEVVESWKRYVEN